MYVFRNQYAEPKGYGVPNPRGPRVHNWKGGPLNEGSLYHGPIYTRPAFLFPWMRRPLNGTDDRTVFYASMYIGILQTLYPDLHEEYLELAEKTSASDEEFELRVGQCAEAEFPTLLDEGMETQPPRERMQDVLSCIRSKESNLGMVLPLVAGGALLVWLFTRK